MSTASLYLPCNVTQNAVSVLRSSPCVGASGLPYFCECKGFSGIYAAATECFLETVSGPGHSAGVSKKSTQKRTTCTQTRITGVFSPMHKTSKATSRPFHFKSSCPSSLKLLPARHSIRAVVCTCGRTHHMVDLAPQKNTAFWIDSSFSHRAYVRIQSSFNTH